MSTPIETAAEALAEQYEGHSAELWTEEARVALASLAQHRDDIARVQFEHRLVPGRMHKECACGRWPYDEADDLTLEGFARHQADAVLAYLTGEAS